MSGRPKVVNVTLVGGAYRQGFYFPGWGSVKLDNGKSLFVSESRAVGFQGVLDEVEDRADTSEYRERLKTWVKTGRMPEAKGVAA